MSDDEKYNKLDFIDDVLQQSVTRRDFLKYTAQTAAGIYIFFSLGDDYLLAQQRRLALPTDFNAYLRIGEDGMVSCFTGKIEMGQGVVTSLAQMLSEELDVSLDTINMVMGDTDLCPWDQGTFGSMTTRIFGPALRAAGAEARATLMELAAEQLKVPKNRLTIKNGVISDKTNRRKKVSYAQLAKGKKIAKLLKNTAALKNVSEYTVIGKPIKRMDAIGKVTGKAKYAGDVQLPGMVYARILRPPVHGTS